MYNLRFCFLVQVNSRERWHGVLPARFLLPEADAYARIWVATSRLSGETRHRHETIRNFSVPTIAGQALVAGLVANQLFWAHCVLRGVVAVRFRFQVSRALSCCSIVPCLAPLRPFTPALR